MNVLSFRDFLNLFWVVYFLSLMSFSEGWGISLAPEYSPFPLHCVLRAFPPRWKVLIWEETAMHRLQIGT